jgi:hypothetical protein
MVNAMKKPIIITTLLALTPLAFAQNSSDTLSPETKQAAQEWVKNMAEQQANAFQDAIRTGRISADKAAAQTGSGVVEIYSIKDYPAPDAVRQSILRGTEMSRRGILTVPPARVLTEAQVSKKLAQWNSLPLEVLKKSLTFSPAELAATPLSTGKLLDAGTVGVTLSNGLSTGLTRTYQVPGIGIITFDEEDYPSSPTLHIRLAKESFNTDIGGVPAIARAVRTTDGRGSALLRWITPRRSYELSLITDHGTRMEQNQQLLKTIASQMVEIK